MIGTAGGLERRKMLVDGGRRFGGQRQRRAERLVGRRTFSASIQTAGRPAARRRFGYAAAQQLAEAQLTSRARGHGSFSVPMACSGCGARSLPEASTSQSASASGDSPGDLFVAALQVVHSREHDLPRR